MHPLNHVDDPTKRPQGYHVKPQPGVEASEDFLLDKRNKIPKRSALEMIESTLAALNLQLDPLLQIATRRDLDDAQLDRMIRINSAAIAIHRQLSNPNSPNTDPDVDPSTVPMSELKQAAKTK